MEAVNYFIYNLIDIEAFGVVDNDYFETHTFIHAFIHAEDVKLGNQFRRKFWHVNGRPTSL